MPLESLLGAAQRIVMVGQPKVRTKVKIGWASTPQQGMHGKRLFSVKNLPPVLAYRSILKISWIPAEYPFDAQFAEFLTVKPMKQQYQEYRPITDAGVIQKSSFSGNTCMAIPPSKVRNSVSIR